jgi:hypothetical protein
MYAYMPCVFDLIISMFENFRRNPVLKNNIRSYKN